MRRLIDFIPANCVGCNRCARLCPIESANRTFLDANGTLKVRIDHSKCVVCGRCVFACAHSARIFIDDNAAFFRRLKESEGRFSGSGLSVVLHPAFNSNFGKDSRRIITWLKKHGVKRVFDSSEGMAIFAWATCLAFASREKNGFIVAGCPAAVNYAEFHREKMVSLLSPVMSPLMCQVVYLRALGVTDDLAAVTPCIAAADEFAETFDLPEHGGVKMNVTFGSLWENVTSTGFTDEESGTNGVTDPLFADMSAETVLRIVFDYIRRKGGILEPSPAPQSKTLTKMAEFDVAGDAGVFDIMDEYVAAERNNAGIFNAAGFSVPAAAMKLPILFPLSCRDGCEHGPAGLRNGRYSVALPQSSLSADFQRQRDLLIRDKFADLSRQFSPEIFYRKYEFKGEKAEKVSPDKIDEAFEKLGKHDFLSRNFNCGSCGSDTCYEMARKIASSTGIPESCIHKLRRDSENERKRNERCVKFIEKLSGMLCGTDGAGDAGIMAHNVAMNESLELVMNVFESSAVTFWEAEPNAKKRDSYHVRCLYRCALAKYSADDGDIKHNTTPPQGWVTSLFCNSYLFSDEDSGFPYSGILGDSLKTMLAVPVRLRGENFAFIALCYDYRRVFTSAEISTVASIGTLLLSSVTASKLERSACFDELTGVYNRRAFSDIVIPMLEMNHRECPDRCSSMVMMDLDFFKHVNDTYGHQAGDLVLRSVADAVRAQLRPYDIFARYGGEEFCVYFDKTSDEQAYKVSERIRKRVSELEIEYDSNIIKLTISIGLAQLETALYPAEEALKKLFKYSDESLYRAKQNGRNRICIHKKDEETTVDVLRMF